VGMSTQHVEAHRGPSLRDQPTFDPVRRGSA
jgi:hypothetical protein